MWELRLSWWWGWWWWSWGFQCHVDLQADTNISEQQTFSIFSPKNGEISIETLSLYSTKIQKKKKTKNPKEHLYSQCHENIYIHKASHHHLALPTCKRRVKCTENTRKHYLGLMPFEYIRRQCLKKITK